MVNWHIVKRNICEFVNHITVVHVCQGFYYSIGSVFAQRVEVSRLWDFTILVNFKTLQGLQKSEKDVVTSSPRHRELR